jgi:hypothetical protein
MIKYEAYKTNEMVQFLIESEAIAYAAANDMQVREIDEPIIVLPKKADWTGLKNALFANFALLQKCLPCNAYPLVADMIISAETGAVVYESNFLLGWQLLQSELVSKGTALTESEIAFINENLVLYDFSITLT